MSPNPLATLRIAEIVHGPLVALVRGRYRHADGFEWSTSPDTAPIPREPARGDLDDAS